MASLSNMILRGYFNNETRISARYEKFPRWLVIALVLAAITKLLLVSSQTLIFFPSDDLFFVKLAGNIVAGHWLGHYNEYTLAKGPFYPLYIAISFFAGIRLLISQQLLYIAACATFVAAVRGLVKKPAILFLIYLVLLFNPMSFSGPYTTRVLREGIYHSLTIFTISCGIGLFLQHNRSIKRFALWAIGLGFSLSFLWLTREEGIWILPSVIILVGLTSLGIWFARLDDKIKRLSLCVLPFIIWFLLLAAVASVNKAHYGVYRITDFKSRSFITALHSLMRVKPEEWKPMLPVPAETRKRIYKVSPAFAELEPLLEGKFTKKVRSFSCFVNGICDDIAGGWFMWSLRATVAKAGHYRSAKDADNYYMRLTAEINAACADKKLECLPRRASISIVPPLNSYYMRHFMKAFTQGFLYLTKFDGFTSISKNWRRPWRPENRMLFNDITGEQTAPPLTESSLIMFSGWAFSPDTPLSLSIGTKDGNTAPARIKNIKSPDMYRLFMKKGITADNAKKARFAVRTTCEDCYLYVRGGGALFERIPLQEIIKAGQITRNLSTSSYYANIHLQFRKANLENRLWLENIKGSVLGAIAVFYQYTAPFMVIFALVIHLLGTIKIFRKKLSITYIFNTVLWMAILLRLSILSIIDITLFPAVHRVGYLSPAHPLLLMIIIFSLLDCKTMIVPSKRSIGE